MHRVILKAKAAGSVSAADATAAARERLMDGLRKAGASLVEPIADQPMVVAELSGDQLDHLLKTGLVEKVYNDQPLAPQ